ncbi:MAG TPA: DUF4430 domain-containing protein [Bacilli bacterium]|nr:DUF4430 domain-containing protein [Bacilli bacterium]
MKLKGKLIVSLIAGLILLASVIYGSFLLIQGAQNDGHVTITILDENGTEVGSKEVGFKTGDSFIEVLNKSGLAFEFSEPHPQFGVSVTVIKGISLGEFQWWEHSINGSPSMTGVSTQAFQDGDIFVFQVKSWA